MQNNLLEVSFDSTNEMTLVSSSSLTVPTVTNEYKDVVVELQCVSAVTVADNNSAEQSLIEKVIEDNELENIDDDQVTVSCGQNSFFLTKLFEKIKSSQRLPLFEAFDNSRTDCEAKEHCDDIKLCNTSVLIENDLMFASSVPNLHSTDDEAIFSKNPSIKTNKHQRHISDSVNIDDLKDTTTHSSDNLKNEKKSENNFECTMFLPKLRRYHSEPVFEYMNDEDAANQNEDGVILEKVLSSYCSTTLFSLLLDSFSNRNEFGNDGDHDHNVHGPSSEYGGSSNRRDIDMSRSYSNQDVILRRRSNSYAGGSTMSWFLSYSSSGRLNSEAATSDECDRFNEISNYLTHHLGNDKFNGNRVDLEMDENKPIPASVIDDKKEVWIVTTAALPWFTGTSVNPLLRAAYLAKARMKRAAEGTDCFDTALHALVDETKTTNRDNFNGDETEKSYSSETNVHLVVPWLELESDRVKLYGSDWKDKNQNDQRQYMLRWLRSEFKSDSTDANNDENALHDNIIFDDHCSSNFINIHFYMARYHEEYGSIFPMGDVCGRLPVVNVSNAICVLEEPEHLNYFRAPSSTTWRSKFAHVVGVIHTNYPYYAAHKNSVPASTKASSNTNHNRNRQQNNNNKNAKTASAGTSSSLVAGTVEMISAWMVQAYCDKVIKLSPALPVYAASKEIISAVHGIRNEFLRVGQNKIATQLNDNSIASSSKDNDDVECYFLGKLLWAKGLDKLLLLQEQYLEHMGGYFAIDIYGTGADQDDIKDAVSHGGRDGESFVLPIRFHGRVDHVELGSRYKIFVNPSESEVLCTTTAEAIAMGKFVIVPHHPSNTFFYQFPTCLTYRTSDEFVSQLQFALNNTPEPLSTEQRRLLTWEAATERFIEAAVVSEQDAWNRKRLGIVQQEKRLATFLCLVGYGRTGDFLRKIIGGGPCAKQYEYEKSMQMTLQQEEQKSVPARNSNKDMNIEVTVDSLAGAHDSSIKHLQPITIVN